MSTKVHPAIYFRSPSEKRLEEAFPGKGAELKGVLTGTIHAERYSHVEEWVNSCYNPPPWEERAMCAVNQILAGHGPEVVRSSEYIDRYHQDIRAEYVNMGDTYSLTILLDHKSKSFRVTSWGDFVEKVKGLI